MKEDKNTMDILTPSRPAQVSEFAPERILDLELGQPLPVLSAFDDKKGQLYQRAACLVRLHNRLLGTVELLFPERELHPQEYVGQVWEILGSHINEHLQQDGLPPISALDVAAVATRGTPSCVEERERFLEDAPFVSVIVPTRDRPDLLHTCVDCLLALHYPNYEIIIVDNAPKDNVTAELVARTYADTPRVRYVREDHPGLPWARNLGMRVAQGTLLAYVDDDVTIDPYWLVELVRAFDAASDVVCVTGDVLPLELETPPQFWIEEYGGFSKGFARQIFDLAEHRPADLPLYPYTAGRFGAGANMAFRADYLRSVGGFDILFEIGSDIEAFFQAVARGHRLVYEPAALVQHPHYRDYQGLKRQIHRYGLGLTAFLTKAILERPSRLLELITKIPYGFYFVLSSKSPKNRKKRSSYPPDLTRSELKGMLRGPFVYLSRRLAMGR
jgi:glycosyltransferase involved in cell wall biosynthesis